MAFRQPTHAPPRIHNPPLSTSQEPQQTSATLTQARTQAPAEEEQWILFSAADSSTNRTYTATNTTATRTAGRSRISDFGSLDTAARSYDLDIRSEDDVAIEEDEYGEEDGELDSLDSHLHEFRSEPSIYRRSGGVEAVLPTHDGLGSFRVERDRAVGMGEDVQEHLYSFERFNPRRVKRRRESLEIGQLELENERAADAERMRRIEMWRLEQSRLLVDEIQKESRRRKMSFSTERRVTTVLEREEEDLATLSTIGSEGDNAVVEREDESFWNRVTRRVIRDLMGIDDDLLSIIFGEALPEDDDLSTTPPANSTRPRHTSDSLVSAARFDESSWEHKLLERIARELGILVNQISDHPGAFNTYLRTQQEPLPYAGLPIIPESARDQQDHLAEMPNVSQPPPSTTEEPIFHPTIQPQTQPLPIPQQSTASFSYPQEQHDQGATPRPSQPILTREEWEADLDISLVFSYLRNRFTSRFRSTPSTTNNPFAQFNPISSVHTNSQPRILSTPESTARAAAARVRQHHPLVTRETRERDRRRSIERARTWKVSIPETSNAHKSSLIRPGSLGRRGSSSCASERGLGLAGLGGLRAGSGVRSGSSRHYWDFGPGSVGSGGGGGLGSWGEV